VRKQTLGGLLGGARAAHDLSLQEVAASAGCSSGYVHKLEADLVRTPSPRVLAGLARALGLAYGDLMTAAGYDAPAGGDDVAPKGPTAIKRYSNAHIVELLEQLQRDVGQIRRLLEAEA
jgi:transcriptional regulator with XRE-family HTH domain